MGRWISGFFLAAVLWVLGFRRRIVRRNLEICRVRVANGFRWRLTFAAARDFCALMTGSLRYSLGPRAAEHRIVMRRGPSLLLTAHFHNWEFLGAALRREGVPLLAASLPFKNPWAERFLLGLRRRLDLPTVSDAVPRAALRHLQQGGCFALLWDQHAPGSDCVGEFFGQTVLLNPLPVFLLRHHPCPVRFGVLLPDGGLRLLTLIDHFDGDWESKLTRRYHRVLEVLARRHPEYWYGFFHARFKHAIRYVGHRVPVPALEARV